MPANAMMSPSTTDTLHPNRFASMAVWYHGADEPEARPSQKPYVNVSALPPNAAWSAAESDREPTTFDVTRSRWSFAIVVV